MGLAGKVRHGVVSRGTAALQRPNPAVWVVTPGDYATLSKVYHLSGGTLNVLNRILGDYAKVADMSTFVATKSDRHSTDLAMLRGARLVTASETEEGQHWAEAKIKRMTGGDEITACCCNRRVLFGAGYPK
ncbi:hypothetical protein [Microvirga sp. VF16]|uniref:hypothetical protein n=1 Tax=Microvirga sp. VF16 TaxID=2807101 RepID=UPI001FEDDAB3|nr:hypothetical protein [Microvirga sp. VF16]